MAEPQFPDHAPTVPELLRVGRERYGSNECVVTPTDRLTYAELDNRSARLAAQLVGRGVGKGSRVGLLFPNGVEWVVAWAAATRIGAVAVPVNTFYQEAELARFLRHSDLQFLLGVRGFGRHDFAARLEAVVPGLAAHPGGLLYLPGLPQLRWIALSGPDLPAWARQDSAATVLPDAGVPDAVVAGLGEDVTPGDPLLISYTSGSTGDPKGVVHTHGAVVRHAFQLGALAATDPDSRIWTPMPLCWVGGFVFCLMRALTRGGCLLTQELFDAGTALRLLGAERVTEIAAWPAVQQALSDHPDFPGTDLRWVRAGMYEARPPDRRPPRPDLAIGSLGMSETGGPHTFKTAAEDAAGAPEGYRGTFGHPVAGVEHRIVDGEVLVRGYSLMQGLYKRERSEVFDADGWYHTGDRGHFRDGWFFFTGRQSDLIKTGGSNVAPAEVEDVLQAEEDVRLAYVVGVPDGVRGQQVVGVVVTVNRNDGHRNGATTGEELRERLRGRLSSYKIPRHVLVLSDEQLPLLSSLKVDRRALATLAERLLTATASAEETREA